MAEHSEPPKDSDDGGSLFSEMFEDWTEKDPLLPVTTVQKAYKKAVAYQEILTDFEGKETDKKAKSEELVTKLNETCDHVGEEIIINENGAASRFVLVTANSKLKIVEQKLESGKIPPNTLARSMGYAAVNGTIHHVAQVTSAPQFSVDVEPGKPPTPAGHYDISQSYVLYLNPAHTGNAEMVNEKKSVLESTLENQETGLGKDFMHQLKSVLKRGESLQDKLRLLSSIEFGENDKLSNIAYADLKADLAKYISSELEMKEGSLNYIAGIKSVYAMHNDIPHDVALAKGRHLNRLQEFTFVPHTTIPAVRSITYGYDDVENEFYYPISVKMHITPYRPPGYELYED